MENNMNTKEKVMKRYTPRSSTETIIKAMRILAQDIVSDDYVANAAIMEAADRLDELQAANVLMLEALKSFVDINSQNRLFAAAHLMNQRYGVDILGELRRALQLMDAAIAKAEGRSTNTNEGDQP